MNNEYLIVARTQGFVSGALVQPEVMTRQEYQQLPEWRIGEYEVFVNGLPSRQEAEAKLIAGEPWRK